MAADLSALLNASKALNSHATRPDLPAVNLSLDQVEALSRRLVTRQPVNGADNDRANYLLAQAHVDAPALAQSIAHLNAAQTFTPLAALADTDVAGFLRAAHEQTLLATIEDARRATQRDFYAALRARGAADWEARKRRVFEQLGARLGPDAAAVAASLGKSTRAQGAPGAGAGAAPAPLSPQAQAKMMAYDRVVAELNATRLRGASYPVVHNLIQAALATPSDPHAQQMAQNFHVLAQIAGEPPALPGMAHAGAQLLNAPALERKHARAYLSTPDAREHAALRTQVARGARAALEAQYWDVLERAVRARPADAQLGGDPSAANLVRAFVLLRHYRAGEWEDRIELLGGQPVWAKLFYLVRTGHVDEALDEALGAQRALESREPGFVAHFRAWAEAADRRLPKALREHLQATYNTHMLHAGTADPFKLALYKLMGKLEPTRRSVPLATATTEDWLWFQLAMVDEEEGNGLAALADVLLGYGERHFDGVPGKGAKRGVWAGVLLMCGQFERAVAALWDHQDTEVEAVHLAIALAYHGLLRVSSRAETSDVTPLSLAPNAPPALSLSSVIWRYVRQFVKMDAKEALQYVYTVCLCADQPGGAGQEQAEAAWELVRRIVVLANPGAAWEELVGGFRPDGSRFPGVIEQGAPLLQLRDGAAFNEHILARAARAAEQADRVPEAVKLYDLAGQHGVVVGVLAHALGTALARAGAARDERARALEAAAADVLRHYERTNRAAGPEREAVVRLLRIREALDAKEAGRLDVALEIMDSTGLIPLDGDVAKITRRADEFRELHEALQRNLPTYLTLTMDAIAGIHARVKAAGVNDATRQMTLHSLRQKSRSVLMFAGALKYRMSPDVYSYLSRLDVEICL